MRTYPHPTMAEALACTICTQAMADVAKGQRPGITFAPMQGPVRARVVLGRLALYLGVPVLFWALVAWLIVRGLS